MHACGSWADVDQVVRSFTGSTVSESASLVWSTIVRDPRAAACARWSAWPDRSFRWLSVAFEAAAEVLDSWRKSAAGTRVMPGGDLSRRSACRVSIPLSPLPHPLPVPLPKTLASGLPVPFVLARLADRLPRPAVGSLQMPPAAVLAAPLVRTVLQGADDHLRAPDALYRTRTAAPPTDRREDPPVAVIGVRVALSRARVPRGLQFLARRSTRGSGLRMRRGAVVAEPHQLLS